MRTFVPSVLYPTVLYPTVLFGTVCTRYPVTTHYHETNKYTQPARPQHGFTVIVCLFIYHIAVFCSVLCVSYMYVLIS